MASVSDLVLRAEMEMAATPEEVWEGLTNPEKTRRWYFGQSLDSNLRPGSEYAYRAGDGPPSQQGTIVDFVPAQRLSMTATLVFDPEMRDDPPHRITWEIERAGADRANVRLTVDGFESETATYRMMAVSSSCENLLKGLSSVADRNVVRRLARRGGIGEVTIKDLTPALAGDFLTFFDSEAFADNPGWSACYCMEQYVPLVDWTARTAEQNRRDQEARIKDGATNGLLAYVDGEAVGWCHYGPRATMLKLDLNPTFQADAPKDVGSIVCFVIAAGYRRHGLSRQLLDAACQELARRGFAVAEGYANKNADSDANSFRGPLQMYLDAGFETFRDSPSVAVMRKPLNRPG